MPSPTMIEPVEGYLRSSRNTFRLSQLGRQARIRFSEETTTELLLATFGGTAYDVLADCPHQDCNAPAACSDWTGSMATPARVHFWKYSRYAEGGRTVREDPSRSTPGIGADYMLIIRGRSHELRFLVQAKRLDIGDGFSLSKKDQKQMNDQLLVAASKFDANPVFVLYVDTSSPHERFNLACDSFSSPCDRAAVIVHAEHVKTAVRDKNRNASCLLRHAHPLACMSDCNLVTSASPRRPTDPLYSSAHALLRLLLPETDPVVAELGGALPAHIPRTYFDGRIRQRSVKKPPRSSVAEPSRSNEAFLPGSIAVIRLGKWVSSTDGADRRGRGWSEDASDEDLREATRRHWRM